MASPQVEDGFLKIATEIADALCRLHISGREWQILWVIIRKTYGWNKKSDCISLNQMARMTGVERANCWHLVQGLCEKKIITKTVEKIHNIPVTRYGFQKDYSKWIVLSKTTTVKGVVKIDNTPVVKGNNTPQTDQTVVKGNNTLQDGVIQGKESPKDGLLSKTTTGQKETVVKIDNNNIHTNIYTNTNTHSMNLGQKCYGLMMLFGETYEGVHKQPYPFSKQKSPEMNMMKSLHAKFDNIKLWQGHSDSQYDHCRKIVIKFFEMAKQFGWTMTPQNLLAKASRVQLNLTKQDDMVYKRRDEKKVDDERARKLIDDTVKKMSAWRKEEREYRKGES